MDPKLPLYHRIENDLKNKIVLGHYKPGDILPSERELIEIYKVSRLTAREAVKRLEMQGLVKKSREKEHLSRNRSLNKEWDTYTVVEKRFSCGFMK